MCPGPAHRQVSCKKRVATSVTCTYGAAIIAGCLWLLPFTVWMLDRGNWSCGAYMRSRE
jgi:hypothetical protein